MVLGIIFLLVIIVIGLLIYNASIYNKIKAFSSINQKINNLNVLQEFMNVIGEEISVDDKIKKVNETLIDKFEIQYSTIVTFNGAEYVIRATNVDEKHWDNLNNLHDEDLFKESIIKGTPKYITIEREDEVLSYQKIELGRAKSAMFFPLYIDSVYIGYWFIESGNKHAFDKLDNAILEVIRENIVAVFKNVAYQNTIENIPRVDLFTGLKSAEYLYGHGKKIVDKYPISTVSMLKIINLQDINNQFSREIGNNIIKEVSKTIKMSLSNEYIFVRYMGPKFAIVFSGVEPENVLGFISDVKKYAEEIRIPFEKRDGKKSKKKQIEYASPKLNFVVSTYYKGTSMDGITKKLEEYLEYADKDESDVNYI